MTGTVGEPTVSYGHFLTGDGNCKAAGVEDGDICAAGRTYVRETRSCERSCALGLSPRTSCPAGWSYFGCRCYKHVAASFTWAEARDNCRNIAVPDNGGDLASVDRCNLAVKIYNVITSLDCGQRGAAPVPDHGAAGGDQRGRLLPGRGEGGRGLGLE